MTCEDNNNVLSARAAVAIYTANAALGLLHDGIEDDYRRDGQHHEHEHIPTRSNQWTKKESAVANADLQSSEDTIACTYVRTHTSSHARTHARTHGRTHARTHGRRRTHSVVCGPTVNQPLEWYRRTHKHSRANNKHLRDPAGRTWAMFGGAGRAPGLLTHPCQITLPATQEIVSQ